MKKHILISLLFFVGGLACGYLIHLTAAPSSPPGPAVAAGTNAEQQAPTSEAPAPEVVLERILPNTSVFWVLADFKRIGEHKDAFTSLWNDDAVQTIGNEFLSALPSGATQAFQALSGASDAMRLFFLPPPREGAPMTWIAAFTGDNDSLDSLLSDIPESDRETKSFGPNQIDLIKTPFGKFAVKQEEQLLWLSMAAEELAGILNTPAPPGLTEKPAIHEEAMRRFPHAAVALFTNSAHAIPPGPGVPGMAPQLLSHLGADSAYVVLHWPNGEGRLTAVAQAEIPPPWTAAWTPMQAFPFGADDPAGLLEVAFRRPAPDAVLEATEGNQGKNETPAPSLQMQAKGKKRAARREAQMSEDQPGGSQGGMASNGMMDFFSMAKPNQIFSFNVFGFYQGAPSMAFAFPEFDSNGTLLDTFQQAPRVQSEEIEIANLPGTHYQFKEGKRRAAPLSELIALERDGAMYLFDSSVAARNYMGDKNTDPDGKKRRSNEARQLLSQVRSPAQAQAAVSRDWFDFILRSEMAHLNEQGAATEQFELLIEALAPHLKPAAASAGFDGKEWFVDVYVEDESSILVESLLTAIHGYRWLHGAK
ncbi:MAG: hypothetical protein P9L94_15775 [Candidatus Hinthialibacter antarcticus]|nr:hypothetical protein [Candidatus Hinthialibacter antarcticus]